MPDMLLYLDTLTSFNMESPACNTRTNYTVLFAEMTYEPRHDIIIIIKTNKMSVPPAKTQISLGIRSVWSVFAVRIKSLGP